MIVGLVWANTLRGQLTSASAVARLTGLSQQTVSRYLGELVAEGILERERRGWSVTLAAFDRPVLRRGKDRAPMDELIAAVHWASAELRKLSKLER
jgi:DNA-binding GntR family transcriptional regulator